MKYAKAWTTVPEQKKCSRSGDRGDQTITSRSKGKIFMGTFYSNDICANCIHLITGKTKRHLCSFKVHFTIGQSTIRVDNCDGLQYIEHIQAHVTLGAVKRGDVQIWLVSPKGTRSNLIGKRPKDYSRAGFNDWPFLTVSPIYQTMLVKQSCPCN